jgi:hypothetical protein
VLVPVTRNFCSFDVARSLQCYAISAVCVTFVQRINSVTELYALIFRLAIRIFYISVVFVYVDINITFWVKRQH